MVSRKLVVCIGALSLSACTAVEGLRPEISAKPLPSRLDEIAYLNTLRSAFEIGESKSKTDLDCFTGRNLAAFKSKLGQGYRNRDDPEQFVHGEDGNATDVCIQYRSLKRLEPAERQRELSIYLDAGLGLTDIYCNRFFTVAIASQRNRAFAHSELASVGNLVNAVLGVAGAGETALTVTGAAFGFGGKSLEGYDLAYLVSPDMPDVQRLVTAEQRAFRAALAATPAEKWPSNYQQARHIIEAYAHNCSFSGMKQLVDKSVKDRTDGLNESPSNGSEEPAPPGTPVESVPKPKGTAPAPDAKRNERVKPQLANPLSL